MEHGTIETVKMKDGIVYCNVDPLRYSALYEGVPVLKSHSGFIKMPKQGDMAMIDTLSDGSRYIQNVFSREPVHEIPVPTNMKEGEMTFRLDEETQLTFSKTPDGKHNIDIQASKDVNIEAGRDINIEAGRDININADQDVVIQDIPFMDHVHSYDDETINDTGDGTGSSSTSTKTSDTPQDS
jgi:hypothetical protein